MQHPKSNISFPLAPSSPQRCSSRLLVELNRINHQFQPVRLGADGQKGEQKHSEKPENVGKIQHWSPNSHPYAGAATLTVIWMVNTKKNDLIKGKTHILCLRIDSWTSEQLYCSAALLWIDE